MNKLVKELFEEFQRAFISRLEFQGIEHVQKQVIQRITSAIKVGK